ncbi:MAG: Nramp family divalent metal transporter [Planctomycetaceae bacterium]
MTHSADPYSRTATDFEEPPRGLLSTLRRLGPGMILVGSIVGSGELIVTTKLGAVAGFRLLWFVLLSCLVKVVVQAELARHTISSGQTFLDVFNALPGPAVKRPAWLTVSWMGWVVAISIAVVALVVHAPESLRSPAGVAAIIGVGALAAVVAAYFMARSNGNAPSGSDPIGRPRVNWVMCLWLISMLLIFVNSGAILGGTGQTLELAFPGRVPGGSHSWAMIAAVVAAVLLLSGTYRSLELTLVAMVAAFTLLTILCTAVLQWTGYALTWSDIGGGLRLETGPLSTTLVLAALAMYAGTGVAFSEMQAYTYWCVEKGYARNVGENQPGEAWGRRARGWIRVMYIDVFVTMLVYTISTVCFYLLGAGVLSAMGLNPDGQQTLATLGTMYTETLGSWAATLFIVGAFFVLYSTVVAGAAGASRMLADALAVMGLIDPRDYAARQWFIRAFVVFLLVVYCIAYWLFENPPQTLLVTSSLIGAIMYPVLGLGALYLRHHKVDPRITPSLATTGWLWICALALAVISPGGILLALAVQFGWITIP